MSIKDTIPQIINLLGGNDTMLDTRGEGAYLLAKLSTKGEISHSRLELLTRTV